MRKELQARAEDAVVLAKEAGADDVFALASRNRSVRFQVRNGKLEEVEDSASRDLSLRIFASGRYSSHSTTDLRTESLKRFVSDAVELTRALQPDPHRAIPDPALFAGRPAGLDLFDAEVPAIARERRLAWCHAMNSRVHGKRAVISADSGAADNHLVVAAASSNGFSGSYEQSSAWMWTEVTLEDGEKRPNGGMAAGACYLRELPSPESVADEALRWANALVGMAKGPTARMPMVVDQRAAGSLVSRLLGPVWGGAVQQERSLWRGRLGQRAISELLTVIDEPALPRGLGSRPFDDEGIAARRLPIIERGVLKHYYLDTYYASKLGMKPTTGSPSNRVLALGTKDQKALMAEVGSGIYVTSWLGGNMDATTGDFSFGIRGHLIKGGTVGAPIGEMNVTGNILALFQNLVAVGNDPWPYSTTRAPTLVFDGVQFSGA